jgi:hypothetical protein
MVGKSTNNTPGKQTALHGVSINIPTSNSMIQDSLFFVPSQIQVSNAVLQNADNKPNFK